MNTPTLPEAILDSIEAGLLGQETPLRAVGPALDEYFSSDDTRTRAALMNFAIFGDDAAALPLHDRQLQAITRNHACRALLFCASSTDADPSARAWIKGQCHLAGTGGKFRCSEQVSILAEGRSEGFLTNLIFSNLRSDLPLVVWWKAHLRPHFQERLYSRIDRLILDSSQWSAPIEEFELVEEALQSRSSRFNSNLHARLLLHDLAYTRGHEHRRAVAHLFDDPLAEQEVPHLRSADLSYVPGHRHSARYLAAWLVRQLDATSPRKTGPDSFEFQRGDQPFTITLESTGEKAGPVVPRLELRSRDGSFSIGPCPNSPRLLATAEVGEIRKEHVLPAEPVSDEALVSEILMRSGTNLLLAWVLPRFLELLRL